MEVHDNCSVAAGGEGLGSQGYPGAIECSDSRYEILRNRGWCRRWWVDRGRGPIARLSSQAHTESNSKSYHQTSDQTYDPKEQRFPPMLARRIVSPLRYFQRWLVPEFFLCRVRCVFLFRWIRRPERMQPGRSGTERGDIGYGVIGCHGRHHGGGWREGRSIFLR